NTKREAERIQDFCQANDIDAMAISGDVPQKKRLSMLKRFQSGELAVLIGTDVASRGLHIPDVQYVINYDLPQDSEDYVHRIGRTARAGATGDAISFGCETYAISLPDIEDYIGHKIPVAAFNADDLPELKKPAPRQRRDRNQRGPRKKGAKPRPRRSGGGKPRSGSSD
ncbi:MAG: helicase-related protein, partial [Pseudomonadota bacterium]